MHTKEKRIEIIGMFKRGKKVMEILRELDVPQQTVSNAIKRFNELGTSADRKGRGRKKTARKNRQKKSFSEVCDGVGGDHFGWKVPTRLRWTRRESEVSILSWTDSGSRSSTMGQKTLRTTTLVLSARWSPKPQSRRSSELDPWQFSGFHLREHQQEASGPMASDLNPLDYAIWGILEAAIYGRKFRTIEELKAALQEAWERIDLNVLASSVDNWRKRLRACVQANGGYFEI